VSGPNTELRKLNAMVDAINALLEQGNNIAQALPVAAAAQTACELLPFVIDENYIGVTWGRICNLQPDGFSAGGFPVYKIGFVGTDGFIYAVAVANLTTLQWSSARIVVSTTALSNTTSVAVFLIGSYHKDGTSGVLTVQGTCGPVDIDICSLLPA
jgi:hypothetical protein